MEKCERCGVMTAQVLRLCGACKANACIKCIRESKYGPSCSGACTRQLRKSDKKRQA